MANDEEAVRLYELFCKDKEMYHAEMERLRTESEEASRRLYAEFLADKALLREAGYTEGVLGDMDIADVLAAAAKLKKTCWYARRELRRARDEFLGEVLAAVKRNVVAIRRWAERVWRFFHR